MSNNWKNIFDIYWYIWIGTQSCMYSHHIPCAILWAEKDHFKGMSDSLNSHKSIHLNISTAFWFSRLKTISPKVIFFLWQWMLLTIWPVWLSKSTRNGLIETAELHPAPHYLHIELISPCLTPHYNLISDKNDVEIWGKKECPSDVAVRLFFLFRVECYGQIVWMRNQYRSNNRHNVWR